MDQIKFAATSNKFRFVVQDSNTGAPKPALTPSSAGLIIAVYIDNQPTGTLYAQASGNIQTITTLGTWAAPSAGKCRFGEVDPSAGDGLYEFQFLDSLWAVALSRQVDIVVTGAGARAKYQIQLVAYDPYGTPIALSDFIVTNTGKTTSDVVNGSVAQIISALSSGGGGLTQQQVRDAMKLAPTVGSPAAGSIDADLNTVLSNLTTIISGLLTQQNVADSLKLAPTGGSPAGGSAMADLNTLISAILTSQNVRDAMKLAPTGGSPAGGSIDAILALVNNKTSNLPLNPAAVGSTMDVGSINGNAQAAIRLALSAGQIQICTVTTTGFTPTTTQFETALLPEGQFGRTGFFATGVNAGVPFNVLVTATNSGRTRLTVALLDNQTPLPNPPGNGDTLILV